MSHDKSNVKYKDTQRRILNYLFTGLFVNFESFNENNLGKVIKYINSYSSLSRKFTPGMKRLEA